MMGSSIIESEMEQSNDYYVENTVFVAVGKQVEESESVLMWAAEKFAKKKIICILHIHQPAHLITLCEPSFFLNFFFFWYGTFEITFCIPEFWGVWIRTPRFYL